MNRVVAVTTRHWKSLLCLNALLLSATVAYVAYSRKVWTATTQLILPKTTSNLDANLGTLGSLKNGDPGFSDQVNPLKVQASILTSDALLEEVLASDPERSKFTSLASYKRLFKVFPQEQSTIISLTVSGSTPEIARQRSLALTQAYQKRLNELRQNNSQARQQFSQKELNQARERLSQAQQKLAKFQQSSGIVSSKEQIEGIVHTINNLTTAKAQALAQAEASQNRANSLSKSLRLSPQEAIRSLGLGENQNYQFVRRKLAEVDAALIQTRAIFTDDHPQARSLLRERKQLQLQAQQYIAQAADGAKVDTTISGSAQGRSTLIQQLILAESNAAAQMRQAQQLNNQIIELNATLKTLPANQAQILDLQRQVDVAEAIYKGLVAQVQQNNINAFDAYPNVQVLDPARIDSKPVSPKLSLILINAVLASVIASIAAVLFLESRNPLLTPKDLQGTKFSIVVRIPRPRHSGTAWELGDETEVEFQRLASAVSLKSIDNRRLLVASATVGEGKTTVTLKLACALVDLGFRVLLVDGDFRQAELSRRLRYKQESKVSGSVVRIQQNLDLLPTLPKQGKIVEMVRRGRFEQALAAAESAGDYDYVIVDSAPVSLTSETALMAAMITNVLFVVKPGTSYSNPVNDSLTQLTQHNAKILGLVVNGVEKISQPYPYQSNNSFTNS